MKKIRETFQMKYIHEPVLFSIMVSQPFLSPSTDSKSGRCFEVHPYIYSELM